MVRAEYGAEICPSRHLYAVELNHKNGHDGLYERALKLNSDGSIDVHGRICSIIVDVDILTVTS